MKIGIMQPYFFPYLGYWQLMNAVDRYVVYDDVNYIKGGRVNRNKILIQREGLKPENIIDSGICSVCHSDIIHSYRIEKKDYNTETAVIELK